MKQFIHASAVKCCAMTLLVFCTYFTTYSQYSERTTYWEGGLTIGPSNFLGDLGGNYGKGKPFLKDNNIQMTKLTYGVHASYHPSEVFAIRIALNFGTLEGDDAIIKGKGGYEEARRARNSDFKSKFQELFVVAEFYPGVLFEYEPEDVYHKMRPYLLAGVGGFHFNPMGTDPLTGEWVALKPLRTEGQGMAEFPDRKEYKLYQVNVPMGVGMKYYITERSNLSLEVIHRTTFTDYIDDVSTRYIDPNLFYQYRPQYFTTQTADLAARMANKSGTTGTRFEPGKKRGTAENNDAYYSIGFKFSTRIGADGSSRWNNSTRCPIRF